VNERRTFGPVVLVGLAATGFTAFAGHQPMLRVPEDDQTLEQLALAGDLAELEFPLAGALALIALAAWGVLLVVRGRFRQAMAVVAAVAAAGVGAVLLIGGFVQNDDAAADIADQLGRPALADLLPLESTLWFWPALVAAMVSTAAAFAAVLLAPTWPEMGSRYDAPSPHRGTSSKAPPEERTSLDLWKSMDEGDDPTDPSGH